MRLIFKNINVNIGHKRVLSGITVKAEKNLLTGIIGPNGSGKSTLIKTLFGLSHISSGTILLDGVDARRMSGREIARKVGYVGQESYCPFDFTVREIVAMGLFPASGLFTKQKNAAEIVDEALEIMHISHFASRSIQTLSGGEKKMVYIARAIAQRVDIIVLDEPTNHLDIHHQLFILDYLKQLNKTVLLVIHDLMLAAKYCDKLYMLHNGKNIASGDAKEVLTGENLASAFRIKGGIDECGNFQISGYYNFQE